MFLDIYVEHQVVMKRFVNKITTPNCNLFAKLTLIKSCQKRKKKIVDEFLGLIVDIPILKTFENS